MLEVLKRDLEVPEDLLRETNRSHSSARSGRASSKRSSAMKVSNRKSSASPVRPAVSKFSPKPSQYRNVMKPKPVPAASLKREEAPRSFVMDLQMLDEDDACLTRL